MEMFKINRDFCEAISQGICEDTAKRLFFDNINYWKAITVLDFFLHGITGEVMYYIRIDSVLSNKQPVCRYETITNAELQEYKKYIVPIEQN